MTHIKNAYLIGLMTAGLLITGCGGGGSNSDNDKNEATEQHENESSEQQENSTDGTTTPPTTTPVTSGTKTFTVNVMPVLNAKCKNCHGKEGKFTITTPSATYANISDLKMPVSAAGKYLLDKGSQTISHGGGLQISTSSTEYATIKSWVDSGADFN